LVNEAVEAKEIKRMTAKKTYIRKPGESYQTGEWDTLKGGPCTPELKEKLIKHYGPDVKILGINIFSLK